MKNKGVMLIIVALLNIAAPIMFVWHTELYMFQNILRLKNPTLTNGFMIVESVKVYHLFMYFMFFAVFCTAVILIIEASRSRIVTVKKKSPGDWEELCDVCGSVYLHNFVTTEHCPKIGCHGKLNRILEEVDEHGG